MVCSNPYVPYPGQVVGCGQCLHCRINRSRIWTTRMMLEAMMHEENSFVSLTYSDDNLPEGGNLVKADFQKFLKRLRKHCEPKKIRFFGVGEYGDVEGRPHYHAALFGVGAFDACVLDQLCKGYTTCPIFKSWDGGFIVCGSLTKDSARYMTKYITKGWTKSKFSCMIGLKGRAYEFASMSLKPGIGMPALEKMAEKAVNSGFDPKKPLNRVGSGKRSLPLGRYLSDAFNEIRGVPMRAVMDCEQEWYDEINMVGGPNALWLDNAQKRRQIEVRHGIFQQRRML